MLAYHEVIAGMLFWLVTAYGSGESPKKVQDGNNSVL
jgi:hypothetical protein